MRIFLKQLTGQIYELEISPENTVNELLLAFYNPKVMARLILHQQNSPLVECSASMKRVK